MTDTNNMTGVRSVYMAYGVFKLGGAGNVNAQESQKINGDSDGFSAIMNLAAGKVNDSVSALNEKTATNGGTAALSENGRFGQGAYLEYTRIITATVPKDIASAMSGAVNGENSQPSDGAQPFSINDGAQELKITIKVSGNNRIYTASGVDKDGNAFTKEIDPYDVDPTNTDYAGFATLCAYIRDTEGMADDAMRAVREAMPEDITEKGDYLIKVGFVSEGTGNLTGAKKLFEQMENFFDRLLGIGSLDVSKSGDEMSAIEVSTGSTSDSSNGSYSKGSFHSRILEELNEMIELMMQKLLNELMGIEGDEEVDDAAEVVAEVAENNADKEAVGEEVSDGEMASDISDEVDPLAESSGMKASEEKTSILGGTPDSSEIEDIEGALGLENAVSL